MAMNTAEDIHIPESPLVLLVEDNLLNQKVAAILLQRLGLTVKIANNGKEALDAVAEDKFSLILMDCHMPEMDGFEAAVAIRKLEALSGTYTPIIAVTALAMGGDRERCIAAGMDDYISKPIDKDLLKLKINHWLRTDVVYESHKLRRKYLRPNSTMTLIDGKPIDLDELEEFYGAEQMNRIRPQMFERHARGIAGLAHEVKASCASIGAKQLARLCLYLEQAVGQQDWIEAEQTLTSLERSFESLKNYVEGQIQEQSPISP